MTVARRDREDNMAKSKSALDLLREIVFSLPDTEETLTWGKPHFRVMGKIFCGYGEEKGKDSVGFKLEMDHADALVANDPRFERAPYVGHKGWVSMDAAGIKDAGELRDLILESYRLIAPKKSLAKLGGTPMPSKPSKARTTTNATAKPSAKAASKSTPKAKAVSPRKRTS